MADGIKALRDQRAERTRRPAPPPRNPRPPDKAAETEAEPNAAEVAQLPSGHGDVAAIASQLPEPYMGSEDGELTTTERTNRDNCLRVVRFEAALFWAKGKALHALRDGRFYKDTHTSWEAFCIDYELGDRRRVDQMIEVWPLAQKLTEGPGKIFPGFMINEAQVRVLLPLAKRHGDDAAVFVYSTLLETGRKVTAKTLQGVLSALPPDRFIENEVAKLIHELPGPVVVSKSSPVVVSKSSPADRGLAAEFGRLRTGVRRISELAQEDPATARRLVDELTKLLEEIRASLK